MIVNHEVRDYTRNGVKVLDPYGREQKFLYISYVGKDGEIKSYFWILPQELMYSWKLATKKDIPDPQYVSWDNKPVVKVPIIGKFSDQRIHEIFMDMERWYPDDENLKDIRKLYIPKTAYLDIEVNVDDTGFPEAKDARNTVNTVSFIKDDVATVLGLADLSQSDIDWIQKEIDKHCEPLGVKYKFVYRYFDSEVHLLHSLFFDYIAKTPCITGWNYFGYDWPYLVNRAANLGIDISSLSPTGTWVPYVSKDPAIDKVTVPMHKCMYDYMEIYKKLDRSIQPKESNKLDWVADRVLGIKKVVHQLGFKEMWERQKKEYVFYNAIDSVLVKEIDKKLKTSAVMFGLASLMNVPLLSSFASSKSIEIVQAEYLYKENKVFPVVKKSLEKKEYEGAFVFQPIPGIYKNVYCLDYASLYPTTMRQFNISPDTFLFKDKNYTPKDNEIKCVNGSVYRNDIDGFIPKILGDFFAKRKAYKKEMVRAQKERYKLEEILERREKELAEKMK